MSTQIVIPTVGESVSSGVIAAWRKREGEFVDRDEVVLDLETDKVTLEVPAPAAGVLRQLAKEGDQVAVGAVVGAIDEQAGEGHAGAQAAQPATPDGMAPSNVAGTRARAAPGEPAVPAKPEVPPAAPAPEQEEGGVRATPLARKVAEELGVDLASVVGTGAGNRIREQDVVAFAQSRPAEQAPAKEPVPAPPPAPTEAGDGRGITRERMSPLRQRIAQRLVEAQHTAAMLTTFNECDMSAIMELRRQFKEEFEKRHGVGLGFMSFFINASVSALRAFPMVNAFMVNDDQGRPAIEKHDYCDIAIAVASPKGLVVPVIRGCERLSMAQVERAVKDLGTRARDGKLTLEEMQGGTFTITNGGIFGSLLSTPILNPPQSAILGMHAIKGRPAEDPDHPGRVVIRPMMYLALSYDHRVIDGAEAVRFLAKVKEAIEDPPRLLLGL